MPEPKLRHAYFLREFPQGDYIPPGAGTEHLVMEIDRSAPIPSQAPSFFLTVGFEGAYDRHRVKCTLLDPHEKTVWEDVARTRKNPNPTWSVLFQIEFWPRHAGIHTAKVLLDGEFVCERPVEITFVDTGVN